jgi:hypothetical protein
MVLGEGCDIVTRGTCIPSLKVNNSGKVAVLYLTFLLCSEAGDVPNLSLQIFDIIILGKAAALQLTLTLVCGWAMPNSTCRISSTVLMSS